MSQKSYSLQKSTHDAVLIQSLFKMKKARKNYEKLKKQHKYRKNVIAEIINTERQYVQDLKIICEKVKTSAQQFLTQDDVNIIFMNCQEILDWNNEFLYTLENGYQGYNVKPNQFPKPYWIVFIKAANLVHRRSGFQCYFYYCSKFTQSNKYMDQLKNSDQRFKLFLSSIINDLRGMDLQSFLVKPIQRLPKYILLFKDLAKHTDIDHPDLRNIKYLVKYFTEINEENNKNMDIVYSRLQIQQICDQYKLNSQDILKDQNTTYKFEDKLSIIQAEKEQQVQVYALSNLLLLINENKNVNQVHLDSLSFVKDQLDNKYLKNIFQIVGVNEIVQCIAENLNIKNNYIKQFEKLIQENREYESKRDKTLGKNGKMRYPVQVTVIGTAERNYQSFQKHTQYITEISINKIYQNIFIRFNEITELYKIYSKKYPNIEFPKFPEQSWLTYQKTKSIEERKLVLEGFIQTLLQSKEAQFDIELLNKLQLPVNFFDLPQIYVEKKKAIFGKNCATIDGLEDLKDQGINIDKLNISGGEIMKAVKLEKISRKRSACQVIPNNIQQWNENIMKNDPNIFKVSITLPDGQKTYIAVNNNVKVCEAIEFIARLHNLQYFLDFKLYIVDLLQKYRVLDDEEILIKAVRDEEKNNSGFLNRLEQLLATSNLEIQVKLKKYIYFPIELEESDCLEDPIRLIYVASSILDDIAEGKLLLNFKDYCLFAALYYFMRYLDKIEVSLKTLQLDKIQHVIPKDIYNAKPDNIWKDCTMECILALDQQLNQISQQNRIDKLQKKPTTHQRHIDKRCLAAQIILNASKCYPQSNMTLYQVQTYERTQQYFKQKGLDVYPTMFLGFGPIYMHFLNPQKKISFRKFEYNKIIQVRSYPNQVIFDLQGNEEEIRFDTFQSYEIKILVEQYQDILKFQENFTKQV